MRRRPADVEEPGQHGVATFGLKQARLVARMGVALLAGHESRAHHDSHAPAASAARADAGSAIPPAASSGSDTARRTSASSGSRPTTLWTWPPASTPCTISASAPASAAARAASAEATCTSTRAPPARARADQLGTQSERERHPRHALLDRHLEALVLLRSRARGSRRTGDPSTRAIERICSRSTAGSVHDAPSVPRPPACDTSLASRAAAPRPSGACISGTSQPSALTARSVPRVWKARAPTGKLRRVGGDSWLVPRDKFDLQAAERARDEGWPAVEPVLGDLVDWCLDYNWPVARVLGPFLGTLGGPVVPLVREILDGDDASAKYHVLCGVVGAMALGVREELRDILSRLARSPTTAEAAEGIPEIATELLADGRRGA